MSTILIVEDEVIVATDLSRKLERLGYEVCGTALNGREAIAFAASLRPHLVLMDIRLEGSMDGIEAADRIRLENDIPVVYLTAHSDAATIERAKLTGPFGYILKPFEARDLATQIELGLYKHKADQEARRQQEALRESNERYELVLAGADAGIWDWDVPRRKVVFSPRWKTMRGFAEHEVSDAEEEWSRAIHPEDAPCVMAAVQAHFEGKTPVFAEEYRVRRKDGSWMWIADRGLARRNANGQVVRMAGSETDITERKQAEEALRKSRDELALRVEERTAELSQRTDQLSRLSSQLTLVEQRERRRLAILIHDHIQQMLVGAKIGLELMTNRLEGADREKIREICELVVKCLKTARSLNTQLSPTILYELGLGSALKWLAETMQETYELDVRTQIDSDTDVEREEIKVLLFESVRELLFNVVKHAGVASARVEMSRDGGDGLRITVRDHGVGFDPHRILKDLDENCFGLFSIRERLELIGGNLRIESTPGHGAALSLIVPTDGILDPKEAPKEMHGISPPTGRSSLNPNRGEDQCSAGGRSCRHAPRPFVPVEGALRY